MSPRLASRLLMALSLVAAGAAHADLLPMGNLGTITSPSSVAFSNSNVTVGTTSTSNGVTYNFLDQWSFSLDALADVSSIAAAINFVNGANGPIIFGISNLQINLQSDPISGPPLVSWLTVTTPVSGLQQLVALVPTAALTAGNYIVQVRGTVTQPGAYSGSLIANSSVSAVPLPAALPLLLIGATGLGALARRRKPV